MDSVILLRPVAETDLALLGRFQAEPELGQPFEWFGFYPFGGPAALAKRWEETGLIGEHRGLLVVARAEHPDTVAGYVTWRSHDMHGRCWAIGCALLPESRGQGYGTAAQRSLVGYLFAHTKRNRIEAYTDADNVAEQQALQKAGFIQEGVIRHAQFRSGQWHDMVLYSVLRYGRQRRYRGDTISNGRTR